MTAGLGLHYTLAFDRMAKEASAQCAGNVVTGNASGWPVSKTVAGKRVTPVLL